MPDKRSEEDDQFIQSQLRGQTFKHRHQFLSIEPPTSLTAPISPPLKSRAKGLSSHTERKSVENKEEQCLPRSDLATIEAGKVNISDHLFHISLHLSRFIRLSDLFHPRLSISDFRELYKRNLHPRGHHFVIHQHDHPVAGLHYDLRLQINETSSVSWAIMYGLPGNAGSRRLNRNATETRVHSLWVGQILIFTSMHFDMIDFQSLRSIMIEAGL